MRDDLDYSQFICLECGNCCRLPGYVHVTEEDIRAIAHDLGLTEGEFIDKYVRIADKPRVSLKENKDGSCVFLKDNRCIIYAVRPLACRTYPVAWRRNETEATCEGVRRLIQMKEASDDR